MTSDHLQQYLFVHGQCPLPGLGVLECIEGNSTIWHNENKILAPVPFILFNKRKAGTDELKAYVQLHAAQPEQEWLAIEQYCHTIASLKKGEELALGEQGKFYVDVQGVLQFKATTLPEVFFPAIPAKRYRQQETLHTIRVGDTVTDSVAMTEYLEDRAEVKQTRWWIAASILAICCIACLAVYLTQHPQQNRFGSAYSVEANSNPETYQTSNR
ncbi:MAG TPA: hypothetical protein PKK69_02675 [Ferruginibacter sp.]|nr:hypothetical protein [Ferruginibacter sp.]